jgi:hypothetical protein
MHLSLGLGFGISQTIKKTYTRINLIEGGWWVKVENKVLKRRKREVIRLWLNLSSERSNVTR